MDTPSLTSEIKKFLKGDILSDDKSLLEYSHDASIFELKPQLIIFPKDNEDLKNIIEFVTEKKKDNTQLSLTARSAGTDMSGGSINDSIILDFTKYFNHIEVIAGETINTGPGVFYRDFDLKTRQKNLFLPSYPASKNICTLGGMVANNSGGEKTLAHGKTIDYVENLNMVLSDGKEYNFKPIPKPELEKKIAQPDFEGNIYKKIFEIVDKNYDLIKSSKPNVSKNSTGYNLWDVWDKKTFDLTKLLVGSQGTLGLITKAKFKLIPTRKHFGLLVIYLDDLKILPHLITDVLKAKPESFEAFDDNTLKLAIRFMPSFIQILGLLGTIKMGLQFLPDLFEFIIKGVPKFTLLVEFDGETKEEIAQRIEKLRDFISHYKVKIELAEKESQAENFWIIRRESFNLLRKNIKDKHATPFIDDFIIRPELLVEFFPKLTAILESHQIFYTIAGHMGDGNFHIIPLMDLTKKEDREKIPVVEEEVNNLVLQYKGSISAEHNDGLIRGHYLKKMYGEKMFELFKEVKLIFDPQNIFNPHKKVDAKLDFSMSHIRSHF